jgi:hypothetical protein
MFARFEFRSSMPSTIVLGLPNFLVSSLMRILCCSFSISPQTHKSFGSPHVEQTSAMALSVNNVIAIYKSFKALGWFSWVCRSKLVTLSYGWLRAVLLLDWRAIFRLYPPYLKELFIVRLEACETYPSIGFCIESLLGSKYDGVPLRGFN